jgi:hypothetical protein
MVPPMTLTSLAAWIIAASSFASGNVRHLSQPVADAMAEAAMATRLVDADDRPILALAAVEVALAWYETGGQLALDPAGPNDGGASHCWAQIYLPHGARTAEGWTGQELRRDPRKCATVAVRLIRASFLASPACDLCGLTVYARGRDTPEGRALSATRVGMAKRLVAAVPYVER